MYACMQMHLWLYPSRETLSLTLSLCMHVKKHDGLRTATHAVFPNHSSLLAIALVSCLVV
jgi:hypothetical protein